MSLPNKILVSRKRLVKTLGPPPAIEGLCGRSSAPPAFVGCIRGLDSGARTQPKDERKEEGQEFR